MDGAPTGQVVFVSYSREDKKWKDKFLVMLTPAVRERRLEVWTDEERVTVGEKWRPQLSDAIGKSRAALLLVSPNFLHSDFIMEEELPALTTHGAKLFCALVSECLWENVKALEEVQWAHDRKRALDQARNRTASITGVCRVMIEQLLPEEVAAPLANDHAQPTSPAEDRLEVLVAADHPGEPFGVPALPADFVRRNELADVRAAVLAGAGAVGVTGKGLGLHGQGGIGKTVLAIALARDEELCRHFPDGVLWVTLGEDADVVAAQRELLGRLRVDADVRTPAEGSETLTRALVRRQCLLVVDDVRSSEAAAAFRVAGPRGRVLYTTRDAEVLGAVGAEVMHVDVLPEEAARRLLASLSGLADDRLPPEAGAVLEATGRVALAVALVGAAVGRGGMPWATLIDQLRDGEQTFLAHPYANSFKAMQAALAGLEEGQEKAYLSLAVFPQDTPVPIDAIVRHWTHLWGQTPEQAIGLLETLAGRGLLTLKDGLVTFHDLQQAFLSLQADDLSAEHRQLIAAYRALLSP